MGVIDVCVFDVNAVQASLERMGTLEDALMRPSTG